MTEQEAETLAVRLRRVWKMSDPTSVSIRSNKGIFCPTFLATFGEGIQVGVRPLSVDGSPVFYLNIYFEHEWEQVLVWTEGMVNPMTLNGSNANIPPDIADEHLPFFRRGCWLSGCPIEASAHEKAEWIQGFTSEELQAWNLKM